MESNKPDRSMPNDETLSVNLRTAIEEIRRLEPDATSIERVVVRALSIPSSCDSPTADASSERTMVKNSLEPVRRPQSRPWNRITHWTGRLNKGQRIVFSSLAITLLLALFLVWQAIEAKPLSAMEKMAESIRRAKSYKQIMSDQFYPDDPARKRKRRFSSTMYWLAPNSYRQDSTYSQRKPPWSGPGPEFTSIFFSHKPGIFIDHQAKTFKRSPARRNDLKQSLSPENFGNLSGKAIRDLGTKELSGKKVRGFEVDVKEISSVYPESGTMEIWIDVHSSLPVRTCLTIGTKDEPSSRQHISDYQWNIDFDPKLFDTTPPEGYTDATPKPPTSEELILHITEALKIYREASGGHYPQINTFAYQRPLDLQRLLRAKVSKLPPFTTAEERSTFAKEFGEPFAKATKGFGFCAYLEGTNPDFAYHGQTVMPKDKDKVLFRWRLDDGKYEVIFGDLRAETATKERLSALEGK